MQRNYVGDIITCATSGILFFNTIRTRPSTLEALQNLSEKLVECSRECGRIWNFAIQEPPPIPTAGPSANSKVLFPPARTVVVPDLTVSPTGQPSSLVGRREGDEQPHETVHVRSENVVKQPRKQEDESEVVPEAKARGPANLAARDTKMTQQSLGAKSAAKPPPCDRKESPTKEVKADGRRSKSPTIDSSDDSDSEPPNKKSRSRQRERSKSRPDLVRPAHREKRGWHRFDNDIRDRQPQRQSQSNVRLQERPRDPPQSARSNTVQRTPGDQAREAKESREPSKAKDAKEETKPRERTYRGEQNTDRGVEIKYRVKKEKQDDKNKKRDKDHA